jgi:peptide deformylase
MSRLKIETGKDNKVLREVAKPVRTIDRETVKLIQNMEETMEKGDGCGLAAPQVGVSKRVIIVKLNQQTPQEVNIAMVNPEIVFHSEETEVDTEGCLSVPKVFDLVRRYRDVIVKFLDKKGKSQMLKLSELNARVVQHEVDHLNGILFVDKIEHEPSNVLTDLEKRERHMNI